MTDRRKSQVLSVAVFVVATVFPVSHSCAANYYIDSVGGNDSNSGTSTITPWKSHVKAQTASLAAGDTVHFKRGSAFSGPIEITESGTAAVIGTGRTADDAATSVYVRIDRSGRKPRGTTDYPSMVSDRDLLYHSYLACFLAFSKLSCPPNDTPARPARSFRLSAG